MVELNFTELKRLKSLFSELNLKKFAATPKQAMTLEEKGQALDILRSKFPDLFSGLDQKQLADDNFLIKFLSNPLNHNKIRNKVLRNLTVSQSAELTPLWEEAVKTEPTEAIPAEPAATMEGPGEISAGASAPSLPFGIPGPSVTSARAPRIIYRVPQAAKPEIVIANKGGVVVEPPSKEPLVVTNKSGVVQETPPSKIYIANKSNVVIGERPIVRKRFNFSAFKSSLSPIFKGLNNFGSKAGVFFQRNVGKYATVGRIATMASSIIGAVTGGALTNGNALGFLGGGIGGAAFSSWTKSGEALKFFKRVGNGIVDRSERLFRGAPTRTGSLSKSATSKRVALGLVGFLLLFVILGGAIGALSDIKVGEASPINPVSTNPLQITKSVDKTAASVGDEIKFTIKVASNNLAGNKVTITEKIPQFTTFVSADNGGNLTGNTLEWSLDATKSSPTQRVIPPRDSVAPAGFGRSVQRVSATVEQLKADLEKYSVDPAVKADAQHLAETIYNVGVKHNVDPAFIAAIWFMETAYKVSGPYRNNVGSIVFVRPGYLGMSANYVENRYGKWATWDTIELGIEAIALLIETEYYPKGQTDTWTIHSGIDEKHQHAYHGVEHIGAPGQDIQTWEQYVNFYYHWIEVMDRITGGNNFSIAQDLTFIVKADTDKKWVINTASGFTPGIGNANSNQTVVKIGGALEEENPLRGKPTPPAPSTKEELIAQIKNNFNIEATTELNTQQLTWVWEALWAAKNNTTNFFQLLSYESTGFRTIKIFTTGDRITFANNGNGSINLSSGTRATTGNLFKQIIIHELGHLIHGASGSPRKPIFDEGLQKAKTLDGDDLTHYHINLDESFAELVSYYVLNDIPEQPTISQNVKWPNVNPLKSGKYPEHLKLIKSILGEPST